MNTEVDMSLEDRLKCSLSYDPGTGKIFWRDRFKGREAFSTKDAYGYFVGRAYGPKLKAHRVCWLLHYGSWPSGEIDHINGDKSDNRIQNLREVDRSENMRNSRMSSANSTGYTGVHYHKANKKYIAYARADNKLVYLGSFLTAEEAYSARLLANKIYGYHPNHGKR